MRKMLIVSVILEIALPIGLARAELYDRVARKCSATGKVMLVHATKKSVLVCGGISKFEIGAKYAVTRSGKIVGQVSIEKGSKKETVAKVIDGSLEKGDQLAAAPSGD